MLILYDCDLILEAIDLSAPINREWRSERAGQLWNFIREQIVSGAFKQESGPTSDEDAPDAVPIITGIGKENIK